MFYDKPLTDIRGLSSIFILIWYSWKSEETARLSSLFLLFFCDHFKCFSPKVKEILNWYQHKVKSSVARWNVHRARQKLLLSLKFKNQCQNCLWYCPYQIVSAICILHAVITEIFRLQRAFAAHLTYKSALNHQFWSSIKKCLEYWPELPTRFLVILCSKIFKIFAWGEHLLGHKSKIASDIGLNDKITHKSFWPWVQKSSKVSPRLHETFLLR